MLRGGLSQQGNVAECPSYTEMGLWARILMVSPLTVKHRRTFLDLLVLQCFAFLFLNDGILSLGGGHQDQNHEWVR